MFLRTILHKIVFSSACYLCDQYIHDTKIICDRCQNQLCDDFFFEGEERTEEFMEGCHLLKNSLLGEKLISLVQNPQNYFLCKSIAYFLLIKIVEKEWPVPDVIVYRKKISLSNYSANQMIARYLARWLKKKHYSLKSKRMPIKEEQKILWVHFEQEPIELDALSLSANKGIYLLTN